MVDTNVLAALFLGSARTGAAEALFGVDPAWHIPALALSELRNVGIGYLRRGLANEAALVETLSLARRLLPPERIHLPDDRGVLRLAATSGCTAYDCEFVAVALALAVPLATWDKQLLAAFPALCRLPESFA